VEPQSIIRYYKDFHIVVTDSLGGVNVSEVRQHQTIGGFDFEGPYVNLTQVSNEEGLFAIVCMDTKQYYLLDIGYSENIRETCKNSPKKACWEEHKLGSLRYAFYVDKEFTTETYDLALEDLRKMYKMSPCIE
jgi:hypothetical protein